MDRAIPYTAPAHRAQRRSLPECLFRSPLAAFAVLLLLPLVVLFW